MRAKKEINIQIGEQIKSAREQTKLTQEQFAELIDVSPQYISDLERGVVGASISTIKRICSALYISSDQILFGQKSETRSDICSNKCSGLSDEQFRILMDIVSKYIEAVNLK